MRRGRPRDREVMEVIAGEAFEAGVCGGLKSRLAASGLGEPTGFRGSRRVHGRTGRTMKGIRGFREKRAFVFVCVLGLLLVLGFAGLAGCLGSFESVEGAESGRAVLIIGDGSSLKEGASDSVAEMDSIGSYLDSVGVDVQKFYSPNTKWSNVRTALNGANIVVYLGHGSGYDASGGNAGIPANRLNGFSLDQDPAFPTSGGWESMDYHRACGLINKEIIQTDVKLASNSLVLMSSVCYSDGKTGPDGNSVTPLSVIKQRINDYSETFLHIGGNYYAGFTFIPPPGDCETLLRKMFTDGKTLDGARSSMNGTSGGTLVYYNHPQEPTAKVKFNLWPPDAYNTGNATAGCIAGKMDLTASDIINGYVPPVDPVDPVQDPVKPDTTLPKTGGANYAYPGTNYNEYLLLTNPGGSDAHVRIEFTKSSGNCYEEFAVGAGQRRTVNINAYTAFGGENVSLKVLSDIPVLAERSMYFNAGGRTGGHDAFGSKSLGGVWYFAEGATLESFDTWYLVQNPNAEAAGVTFTLMRDDGHVQDFHYEVAGRSRFTLHADELPGFENCSLSAKVESSLPVAAERSVYFNYKPGVLDWTGGHDVQGVAGPSKTWSFAEGCTHKDSEAQFNTWFLIQNPNDRAAKVRFEFQTDDGVRVPWEGTVPARSRYTLSADGAEGVGNASFSSTLTSDLPVIAERAEYFNYGGIDGGHGAVGLPGKGGSSYAFAEGYTAEAFDTFLLIQNPNGEEVTVDITYSVDPAYGPGAKETVKVGPHSRFTRRVDDLLPNAAFGATVASRGGESFAAERAVYFNFKPGELNRTGGHAAVGSDGGSKVWFFAEGYTGW